MAKATRSEQKTVKGFQLRADTIAKIQRLHLAFDCSRSKIVELAIERLCEQWEKGLVTGVTLKLSAEDDDDI